MKTYILTSILLTAFLAGCGSSSGNNDLLDSKNKPKTPLSLLQPKIKNGYIGKDIMLKEVKKEFGDKIVLVKTNIDLPDEMDLNLNTVVLYGKIDNQDTNGLLAINYKYLEKHAKVSVEVYDNSGKLLAASEPKTLDKDPFYFGELTTK